MMIAATCARSKSSWQILVVCSRHVRVGEHALARLGVSPPRPRRLAVHEAGDRHQHIEHARVLPRAGDPAQAAIQRSEEHTSELQSLMRLSYAVICLKKKNNITTTNNKTD